MGRPLVSVVIPTYERANLVERAIDSVLARTSEDFELAVDDASEDDTAARVGAYDDNRLTEPPRRTGPPACSLPGPTASGRCGGPVGAAFPRRWRGAHFHYIHSRSAAGRPGPQCDYRSR